LENIGPIIAIMFALAFLVLLVYSIGFIFYGVFIAPVVFRFKLYQGVTEDQKYILSKKFPYYAALSPKFKIEFERRLKYFLMNK
jgi:hypothetical protein